jgi:signal transduction histidine kinase
MEYEAKANILLVNDNPATLLSLEAILADLNQNVVKAHSGREALKHLLHQDFAVILLDVNMPDMDGFETAALIRQRQRSEHTPIIFVTAVSTSDMERARGYRLGAVDYIFAPVVPEILRTKVAAFVDLFKKTRQVQCQAEELAALNQQLHEQLREVQRLNREIAAANHELEAFSYSVAHDLRAPLRSVHGFGRILQAEYGHLLDASGQGYLRHIREGAERMSQLIDDLLNLSRVTRSMLRIEPVDMSVLVQTITAGLHNSQPDRRVEFIITPGLVVQGDARLLRLALENLLENAWKFTSKHASARIEFGVTHTEVDVRTYFVRDDGAGFDMMYAHKLFSPFQRLHTEKDFPGTGIGLATVQRIIRRHGGQLWAEGAIERGATFYFTL